MSMLAGTILAAAFVAMPNSGPAAPPPLVVIMRDGKRLEVPVAHPPRSHRFIVEFQDPPLARRDRRIAAQASRDTIERFRRDLSGLRFGKSAAAVSIEHEYFRAFHGVSVTLDDASVATVRRLSYVKKVHEDAQVSAFADDVEHLTRIGAPRMWSQFGVHGDGITVAVIDSGIDYTHPALGGGLGAGFKVIAGHDFVANDDDPMDEHGHGTHVAGIIAGNTDEVRGVAPNARLLAYRVIGANGLGETSDVLQAIEWTVDPNQDGDLSDRVDVANMSLGGPGDADSPLSLAVDAATLAGVVFCLASGNTAGEHTVGSPASSRLGLTVGSSESNDRIAPYSSRGPAGPDWTLKPEVIAPGTAILSARLGGGTIVMTGTSMAAPHVAGAVALLLQLHPDWTPADVKGALVGSAVLVAGEVMAQGGGRIDIPTAAMRGISIAPASFTFGRHPGREAWAATRTVTIINRGAAARTYTASFATPDGITVTADPAELTVAPGASRDVVVHAEISAAAGATSSWLSHGGQIAFTTEDESVHVPWVAIDAVQVSITHELPATMLWACDRDPAMSKRFVADAMTLLLPNGRCEFLSFTLPDIQNIGPVTLIEKTIDVEGDLALPFRVADALYATTLGGVDQNGKPISSVGFSLPTPYVSQYNIQFPPDSKLSTIWLGTLTSEPMRTSELRDDFRIQVSEMMVDFPNRALYAIHHAPLRGIHASTTLSTLPSDLRHARVTVAPQPAGTMLHALYGVMIEEVYGWIGMNASATLEHGWSGDLYVNAEGDDRRNWSAVGLHASTDETSPDLMSPMLRLVDGELVASNEPIPSPLAYRPGASDTFAIGEMPRHFWSAAWRSGETSFRIGATVYGPLGEVSKEASADYAYELRDAAGALLQEGTASGSTVMADFGRLGPYRAKLRTRTGEEIALAFDTSMPDMSPPMIMSLRVLDGDGSIVSGVTRGKAATLAFSVFDYIGTPAARASWRSIGGPWHELRLTTTPEGDVLADLTPVTLAATGKIELRVELEDASGNTSTSILPYPLLDSQRRRAVGK